MYCQCHINLWFSNSIFTSFSLCCAIRPTDVFSFFVNNVIFIYSYTYIQDNRENLFSLLSDIYFAPWINPHSNFIFNSCVRDSTKCKVVAGIQNKSKLIYKRSIDVVPMFFNNLIYIVFWGLLFSLIMDKPDSIFA